MKNLPVVVIIWAVAVGSSLLAQDKPATPTPQYTSAELRKRISGDVQANDLALPPISEFLAKAIRFVHERDGGVQGEEIVFNLPCGTPKNVYQDVIAYLGAARPMIKQSALAIHVMDMRIRTVESEIDIIHTGRRGTPEGMTVSILRGQRVVSVRFWGSRVTLPGSSYSGC